MKQLKTGKTFFLENGYFVAKNIVERALIEQSKKALSKTLDTCAQELGCSKEAYLSAVSRWANPSPVTAVGEGPLLNSVKRAAYNLMGESPELVKVNVICKNTYCTGTIPLHQDISYSPNSPYQFTSWLALNPVPPEAGPLEVVPKSHQSPIEAAADFWSPQYQPNLAHASQTHKLPIDAGDIIFFDSRLWHGSQENVISAPRYALVFRWVTKSWTPPNDIPPLNPLPFGMWTCGKETEDFLREGILYLAKDNESDFPCLIDRWVNFLKESPPLPVDHKKAIAALKKIQILNQSSLAHKGGDSTGTLYKDLWYHLLNPLKKRGK